MLHRTLMLWLTLATAALGAEPRAVIVGPNHSPPGVLVVLDGTQSAGSGFAWTIVPAAPANAAVDSSGKYLYFASPLQPGRWTVILAVAEDGQVSLAAHELIVDGTSDLRLSLPAEIREGTSGKGSVTIGQDGPASVALQSSDPARLAVPATVTVPAGSRTAEFVLLSPDNQLEDGDADVRVIATLASSTVSATTKVRDDDGHPVPPEQLWGIVIHESSQASAEKAIVLSSQRIRDALSGRWRIADKDVVDQGGRVPADLAPWLDKAKDKSLPYLFLIGPTGVIYHEGPLPLTVDGVLELIDRLKGTERKHAALRPVTQLSDIPGANTWIPTAKPSSAICPTGGSCWQR